MIIMIAHSPQNFCQKQTLRPFEHYLEMPVICRNVYDMWKWLKCLAENTEMEI